MGKYLSRDLKVLSTAFFFIFMGGSFQQFLIPYLQKTTSWGAMKCSTILMVVYSTFLFWRILVNYSIRVLGDYFSIFLGSLTYSGFVLLLFMTKRYPLLLSAASVWGWGAAALWIVGNTLVLDAERRSRYGMASGVFYFATHAGFAVGVMMLGRIGELFGEDWAILSAFFAMLVGNAVILLVPKKRVERESNIKTILSMMTSAKVKIVGFFLFASSLGFGLMLGAFTGVAKERGFAYLANAAVFAPLARAILSFLGGVVSDKLGRGKTLFLTFAISFLGLGLASIRSNIVTLGFSALGMGLQGGLIPVVASAIIGDYYMAERRPLAFSATFVWRDLGVVVSLFLGQYLSSLFGGVSVSFLAFAIIFLVCALLSLILIKHEGRQSQQNR